MATWKNFPLGDVGKCGSCGQDGAIVAARLYGGSPGFVLACGHRNAYCESCDILVVDASSTDDEIRAVCPFCATSTSDPLAER